MTKKQISVLLSFVITASALAACSEKNIQNSEADVSSSVELTEDITTLSEIVTSVTTTTEKNKVTDVKNTTTSYSNTSSLSPAVTIAKEVPQNPMTTTSSSVTKSPETSIVTTETITEAAAYTPHQSELKFTWMCDGKDYGIYGEGQLAVITFRIKENIPSGDYFLNISEIDGDNSKALYSYSGHKNIAADFDGGIVSVGTGSSAGENGYSDENAFINLSNTSGNPGDTISLYIDLYNCYAYYVHGFSLMLNYDSNALEYQSIVQGNIFDGIPKGTISAALDGSQI